MKSGVLWATAVLVALNIVFFVVFLVRPPGRRAAAESGTDSVPAAAVAKAAPAGIYAVTGVVKELREGGSNVLIRHEAIPGYMPAMTMPFNVRDVREVASVQPGETLTFRLLVTDEESWIDSVKRVGVAEAAPAFAYEHSRQVRDVEPLEIGQVVPDYVFTNELGAPVRLTDFRGKVVGLTFVFTRCPLPDFCPRMMRNFSAVASTLSAGTAGVAQWQLVTMTVDPAFDTPEILKRYAQRENYDPARWTFLTGAMIDIDALTEMVGLVFRRQTPTSLPDHNLRTLVVDAEGRLQKVFIGNTWKPAELIEAMAAASKRG